MELSLELIDAEDIPAEVAKDFWYESGKLSSEPGLVPPEFQSLLYIADNSRSISDIVTFAGFYEKRNDTNQQAEHLVCLADVDEHGDGEIVGVGELRYAKTDTRAYFQQKPFVGYTETVVEHMRKGLGRRRLFAMNALAQHLFGLKLHSDTCLSEEAERLWRRLVREGIAKQYTETDTSREDGLVRYKFL